MENCKAQIQSKYIREKIAAENVRIAQIQKEVNKINRRRMDIAGQ